jgi:hypothetical protein
MTDTIKEFYTWPSAPDYPLEYQKPTVSAGSPLWAHRMYVVGPDGKQYILPAWEKPWPLPYGGGESVVPDEQKASKQPWFDPYDIPGGIIRAVESGQYPGPGEDLWNASKAAYQAYVAAGGAEGAKKRRHEAKIGGHGPRHDNKPSTSRHGTPKH